MNLLPADCCCDSNNQGRNKITVTSYRLIRGVARIARFYSNANCNDAEDWPPALTADVTAGGCSCSLTTQDRPMSECGILFDLQPYDNTVRQVTIDSLSVDFPYLDETTENGTGNWRWHDGFSLIVTNFSFAWNRIRQRYRNVAVPGRGHQWTGANPYNCCECVDGGSVTTVDVYFGERGKYQNNIDSFGVYGASSQYAEWTIEIGGGLAIVRDAVGTLMYQWSLGAHTMDSLRAAIDATTEMVGRRIALATGTGLRNAAASSIPPQGPKLLGQGIATEAKIRLREAGDQLESFQIVGMAYYKHGNNFALEGVREQEHTGDLAGFRLGFALDLSLAVFNCGQLPTLAHGDLATPCPDGNAAPSCLGGACGSCQSTEFANTGGGFFMASSPLAGTASQQVFSFEHVEPQVAYAGFVGGCQATACTFRTRYEAYVVERMFEVTRS